MCDFVCVFHCLSIRLVGQFFFFRFWLGLFHDKTIVQSIVLGNNILISVWQQKRRYEVGDVDSTTSRESERERELLPLCIPYNNRKQQLAMEGGNGTEYTQQTTVCMLELAIDRRGHVWGLSTYDFGRKRPKSHHHNVYVKLCGATHSGLHASGVPVVRLIDQWTFASYYFRKPVIYCWQCGWAFWYQ